MAQETFELSGREYKVDPRGSFLIYKREDGKVFEHSERGYWLEIKSNDGDIDYVKYYGNDGTKEMYVSNTRGFKYTAVRLSPMESKPQATDDLSEALRLLSIAKSAMWGKVQEDIEALLKRNGK